MVHPADERFATRVLIRLALALWLTAALAAVWEGMALQAPDSPFHAGVLAGPIGQLRSYSLALGTSLVGAAWLWPWLYRTGEGRFALACVVTGTTLSCAAMFYAACQGLIGAQLIDPRPDARPIVILRGLGHSALLIALITAGLQGFRKRL